MIKKVVILLLVLTIASFSYFFIDWDSTSKVLKRANYFILALLCILQFFSLTITSYQWYRLLARLHNNLPFKRIMEIHLASKFTENITPSSKLGGEATKLYLLNKLFDFNYSSLAPLMLANKFSSFLPFLVISMFFLILGARIFNVPPIIYRSFYILIILFLISYVIYIRRFQLSKFKIKMPTSFLEFLIIKNIKKFINTSLEESKNFISNKEMFCHFILSSIVWLIYPLQVYLVIYMLNLSVPFTLIALATYSAYCVSMIPILPGGLGSYEATMLLIFRLNGIGTSNALAIVLLSRLITYLFPLIISGFSTIILTFCIDEKIIRKKVYRIRK